MKWFFADLHIHTGLSPCAAEEMTPPAIVEQAARCGLTMIAICDHNSAANTAACVAAARRAATGTGSPCRPEVTVIPGIEITTAEEAHVLGLFPDVSRADAVAEVVCATLPLADAAYAARFGSQRRMDVNGRVVGAGDRMLALAAAVALADVVALIHRHGGVAVAAHVNRPSFSVLSQLGMFPADVGFDAIEVVAPCDPSRDYTTTCHVVETPEAAGPPRDPHAAEFAHYRLPVLASSDAHFLGDIGRARTAFFMNAPTFEELALALQGVAGREVRCA